MKSEFLVTSMTIKTHHERLLESFGGLCFCGYFGESWCVWASDLSYTSFVARLWPCVVLAANDKQKRHKTNPHEKQRHQNGPKQAPLCSAPGLEFYPHVPIWSLLLQSLKHKSQRHSHNHMTGTASGSGRDTVCQFACRHWCTCVFVFILPAQSMRLGQ